MPKFAAATRLEAELMQSASAERHAVFVALKELRFARGRFLLIGAVVALITLLVGFLTGLTGGLAAQNISALLHLPGQRIVLQQPASGTPSFAASALDSSTVQSWQNAAGAEQVLPVGIVQSRAALAGSQDTSGVAIFGLPDTLPATSATDSDNPLMQLLPADSQQVGLSAAAATELGAKLGQSITINGHEFIVAKIGAELWYSHTPVIMLNDSDWQTISRSQGGSGEATALAISGDLDWESVAAATHTSVKTPLTSLLALPSFKSEIGSLGMMIAMLFGISALVVGAFFTVWTMQRSGDIAVLKALGASTASLLRDALGQAVIVLVAGISAGIAAVVGLGALAGRALPFVLSPLTTALPGVIMAVLGLAGAAIALRQVTAADPLSALGSKR